MDLLTLRRLALASACAGTLFAGASAFAQSAAPSVAPAAPMNAPKLHAPRGFSASRGSAVVAPDAVESRLGGCPEGPPCPGEEADGATAGSEDCAKGDPNCADEK